MEERRYDQRLCDTKHIEQDRRIGSLEATLKDNLERLYTKMDEETLAWAHKAVETAQRPGWAQLAIIAFLSSLSVGLIVARWK